MYIYIYIQAALHFIPAVLGVKAQRLVVYILVQGHISSIRQHTSAYVSIRQHTYAHTCGAWGQSAAPCRIYTSTRPHIQHTSAYVSIRQHTSAYVSTYLRCLGSKRSALSYSACAPRMRQYRTSVPAKRHALSYSACAPRMRQYRTSVPAKRHASVSYFCTSKKTRVSSVLLYQ